MLGLETERQDTYLNYFDFKKLLVVSVSRRSEEMRLVRGYNRLGWEFGIWQFQTMGWTGFFKAYRDLKSWFLVSVDRGYLKEGWACLTAIIMSPLNSPDFFPVYISIVQDQRSFPRSGQ